MSKRIVVLISGSGSNLQAILDAVASGQIQGEVCAVISNRADAYGLTRAKNAGVIGESLSHKVFPDRLSFDLAMIERIDAYQPDLVVLAGFMRILTAEFVNHYSQRLINIHPSLLPKYRGLHTHRRALEAGDEEHGCSVHFVTEELDEGPTIVQGIVRIDPDDTEESLQQKVHKQEHVIYPLAVSWFCNSALEWNSDGIFLNGEALGPQGYQVPPTTA